MIDYFFNPIIAGGGEIMMMIFLCSFVIWWLFIDSLLKVFAEKKALKKLRSNQWDDQKEIKGSLFYPFLKDYMDRKKSGQPLPSLSKSLDLILPKLERRLNFAGAVVQLAPLLGLLGTVSGMIMTFECLRRHDVAQNMLSVGIAKALYTTEFGLLVAIPGVYFGFLLNRKVELLRNDFREWLYSEKETQIKGGQ